MTDAKRVIEEETSALDVEDRVWLEEQLDRYSELLTYLSRALRRPTIPIAVAFNELFGAATVTQIPPVR